MNDGECRKIFFPKTELLTESSWEVSLVGVAREQLSLRGMPYGKVVLHSKLKYYRGKIINLILGSFYVRRLLHLGYRKRTENIFL